MEGGPERNTLNPEEVIERSNVLIEKAKNLGFTPKVVKSEDIDESEDPPQQESTPDEVVITQIIT